VNLSTETWSDKEGPECPVCGVVWAADGSEFYDESGFELDCDCGAVLWVQPMISTSWTTKTVRKADPQPEGPEPLTDVNGCDV